jgi:hypothetical protein
MVKSEVEKNKILIGPIGGFNLKRKNNKISHYSSESLDHDVDYENVEERNQFFENNKTIINPIKRYPFKRQKLSNTNEENENFEKNKTLFKEVKEIIKEFNRTKLIGNKTTIRGSFCQTKVNLDPVYLKIIFR